MNFGKYFRAALALILITFVSLLSPFVFLLRPFINIGTVYSRYFLRPVFLACLKIYGIRYRIHGTENMTDKQCIYIANHRSVVDFFVIGALALENTTYFISATNRRYWPLHLIGLCVKPFFIPQQDNPAGRKETFQYAEEYLRTTGKSVFLTPEGDLIPRFKLEHFNRGAFHMATNLHIPISPFYIHVPESVNIGRGFEARRGFIDIYFFPAIDTGNWRIEDIEKNRSSIENQFLAFEKKV